MTDTKTDASELDLIRRAQSGDARAFTLLVKKYEQAVYSFAFKVCRDREKAAETLQDTFVNVYRKLNQFSGKSKFTTWLYSIVTRNCMMKNRRRKIDIESVSLDMPEQDEHDASGEHPPVAVWDETPLTKVMRRELKASLDAAIQKLPVDYRAVFVLRDVEGQSAEETAKILRLSVPAVKSRLRRARVFLRNELDAFMRK